MINLLKIFNWIMISTKGKEMMPHHEFPVRRLWCYVLPCIAIVPHHVLNEVRIITVQERGAANFILSVGPLLKKGHMFYLPVLLPFTLEGYLVKVSRRIHDKWNWLLHPKLTEDRSGWCHSTIQKYINGTSALQICYPTVQYVGREPSVCVYGSHTICISGLCLW